MVPNTMFRLFSPNFNRFVRDETKIFGNVFPYCNLFLLLQKSCHFRPTPMPDEDGSLSHILTIWTQVETDAYISAGFLSIESFCHSDFLSWTQNYYF